MWVCFKAVDVIGGVINNAQFDSTPYYRILPPGRQIYSWSILIHVKKIRANQIIRVHMHEKLGICSHV